MMMIYTEHIQVQIDMEKVKEDMVRLSIFYVVFLYGI